MLAQKAWRMIRTLIFTYLVSGVLLTALAFALYKFRLPESQITPWASAACTSSPALWEASWQERP